MGETAALSQLIGSIYDCTLDPSRWEQTLAAMRDAVECETAALHLTDLVDNSWLIERSVGIPTYWREQLPKYIPEISARLAQFVAALPSLEQPWVLTRQLSPEELKNSPYVQECLRAGGIVDTLQYFLMQTSTRLAGFAFGRHERQGLVGEHQIELGGLLLPHVRRAVMISDAIDVRTIELARMTETLDALRCGVVMTDDRGVILHVNRSAEHMLHNGGPVRETRGVLRPNAEAAAAELRSAIWLAAQDETAIGKTGLAVRLTEADAAPAIAHVLPLTGSDIRTRLQPRAVAAVFIDAAPDDKASADLMAGVYGLTPAETRVLASLLAGQTLEHTARALGIAGSTAKTHLYSIFSKTGVTRQADLVRLASRIAPPTTSMA